MAPLQLNDLKTAVSVIAQRLDSMNIDYAIMGGAAACLLSGDSTRRTDDVDFVIQVDDRGITADRLTAQLLKSFPSDFEGVSQFGHIIPAYKLRLPDGAVHLVELEVFDYQSWPQRPQYNLKTATRKELNINGQMIKVFSPEWLLREKILSQYQRQGSPKERSDIQDIANMLPIHQGYDIANPVISMRHVSWNWDALDPFVQGLEEEVAFKTAGVSLASLWIRDLATTGAHK
ncbi:hypothetical protein UREG_00506 [Uncinocarpus reesii 1704]|uniref:Uncharacterized protein n=1 Tax=Uncinocarpus reesii (strain UAMH 1704) TaxID=336963 RepID=C4JE82_UNCRE|nr:uncharacterized protein UREG_00506 [Uncinocarpus reesii 1704]EEP75660.1 hypothetical protein UREG_00506 [Uncinocarpus reesii 1704]